MTTGVNLAKWDAGLDASRERTLKTVAGGDIIVTHATGARMVAAWTLVAAPRDPVRPSGDRTREGPATPGSAHGTRSRPRSDLRHDQRAVRPAHRRAARAAHGPGRRRPLHVHAAQGPPPRARPLARSPEPDRPVAQMAPRRPRPDADRRLGAVDGDAARRPAAAGIRRPRRVALAHRPGRAAPRSARRRTHPRRARLAAARRRVAPSPGPSPRGALRDPLFGVAGRGAAVGGSAGAVRGGLRPARRDRPRDERSPGGRVGRLSGPLLASSAHPTR